MASTVLSKMHNIPKKGDFMATGSRQTGDLLSQFLSFKKDIENSGRDPNTMLNELLASGKVSQQQLNKAKTLAAVFANKFKSGR